MRTVFKLGIRNSKIIKKNEINTVCCFVSRSNKILSIDLFSSRNRLFPPPSLLDYVVLVLFNLVGFLFIIRMQQQTVLQAPVGLVTSNDDLSAIISAFPTGSICHALGYGSGVFVQKLSSNDDESTRKRRSSTVDDSSEILIKPSTEASCSPMIDVILVVHDAQQFHEKNIAKHPSHYSSLASIVFGSTGVASVQNLGPGVYFNPYSNIAGFEVRTNQTEHSCSIILYYYQFNFRFCLSQR